MRILAITAGVALLAVAGEAQAQDCRTVEGTPCLTPWNAGHIFIVRYDGKVRYGASGRESHGSYQGPAYRELTIKLTLEEELKGRLRQHLGVPFEHTIHEYSPEYGPGRKLMTLWDTSEIVRLGGWGPGTRVPAWCDGSSDDARELLVMEHCQPLLDDAEPLADTRAIVGLERAKAPLATVLQTARVQVASRGQVFAQYVGARIGVGPMADDVRGAVIDLVASPEIGLGARRTYARILTNTLYLDNGPASVPRPALERRSIRTLFRLATTASTSLPESERDNYASVDLSNAIGLYPLDEDLKKLGYRPTPFHTAHEVFSGAPAEGAAAIAWVRNHREVHWKKPLLDWLTGPTGR